MFLFWRQIAETIGMSLSDKRVFQPQEERCVWWSRFPWVLSVALPEETGGQQAAKNPGDDKGQVLESQKKKKGEKNQRPSVCGATAD